MTLADEDRDRDELAGGNILKRERFQLVPPVEEESDYDSEEDYGSSDDSGKDKEEEKEAAPGAAAEKVDKMYTATALVEEVDAIVGIKPVEYAKCELITDQQAMEEMEIAIIGFWTLKDTGVFRCIHSFVISNPMKREVDDVQGTNLYQVLYPGKNGEVFFFYDEKNAKKEEDNGLRFGILDTESDQI